MSIEADGALPVCTVPVGTVPGSPVPAPTPEVLEPFGPLAGYMADPAVEEVWLNSPSSLFIGRQGRAELSTQVFTPAVVESLVERLLQTSGRRLDRSSPFVDAVLPDGSRLHVVIPDVTRTHMAINIRKHTLASPTLADLTARGTLSRHAAEFLTAAVRAGLNILVAGGTQTGKTTVLGALAADIPAGQRVITAEEVFELHLPCRDLVAMQCRQASYEGTGEITLRHLLKEALRMRPDRIIVGEVREAEALDLLLALNAGVPGMCTLHANSAAEALSKLCTLPLLAGENVTASFVVPTVASAIDLVVHLVLQGDGSRQVSEIVAVSGRLEEARVETARIFVRDPGGNLVRGPGGVPASHRFERAGIDVHRLLSRGRSS